MMTDAPIARTARYDVLVIGSAGPAVASTCSLVRDGGAIIVVDPGSCTRPASACSSLPT